MYIYPYKQNSRSVKRIALALKAKVLRIEGSKFKGGPDKLVINWGASSITNKQVLASRVINPPSEGLSIAQNKLSFFRHMKDTKLCPPFVESHKEALQWLEKEAAVMCRDILTGHSGAGIRFYSPNEIGAFKESKNAPLYVKYIKKKNEYRVHVFMGEIIDVQRKARILDVPNPNWIIRNLNGGFIYAREGIDKIPYLQQLKDVALQTIKKLQIDFGAVDVIYNEQKNKLYVLEVNTAPGLDGTTLERYVKAMRKL